MRIPIAVRACLGSIRGRYAAALVLRWKVGRNTGWVLLVNINTKTKKYCAYLPRQDSHSAVNEKPAVINRFLNMSNNKIKPMRPRDT